MPLGLAVPLLCVLDPRHFISASRRSGFSDRLLARWQRPLLLAAIALPLHNPLGWHALRFSKLPPNQVSFDPSGLTIAVDRSSSPLFYIFDKTVDIKSVEASGSLSALPKIPKDSKEGIGRGDDFALRIGLVVAGKKTISWVQGMFAPEWLKQLSTLDHGQAFGEVDFLNIAQRLPVGFTRWHPSSKYLRETVVLQQKTAGPFSFRYSLKKTLPVLGIWIQCDGDDTQSKFTVKLSSLSVNEASR